MSRKLPSLKGWAALLLAALACLSVPSILPARYGSTGEFLRAPTQTEWLSAAVVLGVAFAVVLAALSNKRRADLLAGVVSALLLVVLGIGFFGAAFTW